MENKEIRILYLYEFKLGHTAADATRNINTAFGKGTVNERTTRRWLTRRLKNFVLETQALTICPADTHLLPLITLF